MAISRMKSEVMKSLILEASSFYPSSLSRDPVIISKIAVKPMQNYSR
ncbi:MAG: hypothetical protein SAK29_08020 [Scytonema sp. PMC 1069.18]|nr:hypothetical protein [Scytonema sp. PMC 1069.18]MEC4884398.1 hypothetical protein [Scytonema sp. PMC 1070.18]